MDIVRILYVTACKAFSVRDAFVKLEAAYVLNRTRVIKAWSSGYLTKIFSPMHQSTHVFTQIA